MLDLCRTFSRDADAGANFADPLRRHSVHLGPALPWREQSGSDLLGFVALSLNAAAYIAEIFRAGIQSIDPGQMEAARSLGMTKGMAMRLIILPQAFTRMLPAIGNEFIAL